MGFLARVKKLTDYLYSPTNPASEDAIRGQIDDSVQEVYDNVQSALGSTTLGDSGSDQVAHKSANITAETVNLALEENRAEVDGKASVTNVLTLDNTTPYTPTTNYHPSTKKYVDDAAFNGVPLGDPNYFLKTNAAGDGVEYDNLPNTNATNISTNASNISTNADDIDNLEDTVSYGTTIGGTANDITITTPNGGFTFVVGKSVRGIVATSNTGAMTANVDADGAEPIKKYVDGALADAEADDFTAGNPFELICQNDSGGIGDFFLFAPKGGATGDDYFAILQGVLTDYPQSVAVDDDYMYLADSVNVNRVNISDKTITLIRGGYHTAITIDADNIYMGDANTRTIFKYDKATLSLQGSVSVNQGAGTSILVMEEKSGYLYVYVTYTGTNTALVRRIDTSTMTIVNTSATVTRPPSGGALTVDDNNVYYSGYVSSLGYLYKSNLTLSSRTQSNGTYPNSFAMDNDSTHVYTTTSAAISKVSKADFGTASELTGSIGLAFTPNSMSLMDDKYIVFPYITGSFNEIRAYDSSTLTFFRAGPYGTHNTNANCIRSNGEFITAGVDPTGSPRMLLMRLS